MISYWTRLAFAWVSQKLEAAISASLSSRRGVESRRRRAARRETWGAREARSTGEASRRRELAREAGRS